MSYDLAGFYQELFFDQSLFNIFYSSPSSSSLHLSLTEVGFQLWYKKGIHSFKYLFEDGIFFIISMCQKKHYPSQINQLPYRQNVYFCHIH